MTQLVTWVTVLPSCCSITTPAETTMVSLFFNRGILQFAREHETWVRLLDHVTQVHPTVLSFSQKIHVWTVLVFLMDRSKLKHNFGTVLQLISFFSLHWILPLLWQFLPGFKELLWYHSLSHAAFFLRDVLPSPFLLLNFSFSISSLVFWAIPSIGWPYQCIPSIRKLMALSLGVGWTFYSLSTAPLERVFPLQNGACVFSHPLSPAGLRPWAVPFSGGACWVQGGRAGAQWEVFQPDLVGCWRTSSVSCSMSWALTVQARLSPLQ